MSKILNYQKFDKNLQKEAHFHQKRSSLMRSVFFVLWHIHIICFPNIKNLFLYCCGPGSKLIALLYGNWKAFINSNDCLFMMSIDGNVKECSLSVREHLTLHWIMSKNRGNGICAIVQIFFF